MRKLALTTAALFAGLLLAAPSAFANPPTGNLANQRLDRRGDRIDHRLDTRSDRALASGHERRAEHLDRKGDRIDRRLDLRGNRIDRRRGGLAD